MGRKTNKQTNKQANKQTNKQKNRSSGKTDKGKVPRLGFQRNKINHKNCTFPIWTTKKCWIMEC